MRKQVIVESGSRNLDLLLERFFKFIGGREGRVVTTSTTRMSTRFTRERFGLDLASSSHASIVGGFGNKVRI